VEEDSLAKIVEGDIYERELRSSSFIETEYHVFLLANPRSGSREATRYTGLDFINCTIPLDKNVHAFLNVFNLTSADERRRCFRKMAALQAESKLIHSLIKLDNPIQRLRLVIAGGDGSLIGAVASAKEAGVDVRHLPVCVLPYGTGNDLAQVTNWGKQPTGPMYQTLRNLMTEICINSREEKLNVWTVKITFKKNGDTLVWNSNTRRL